MKTAGFEQDFADALRETDGRGGVWDEHLRAEHGPSDFAHDAGLQDEPSRAGAITATPYRWRDPASIPRRQWLYGRHLIRGFVSGTIAPGGTGKSKLKTVEALEMVTAKPLLLSHTARAPLRVWLWNLEDPDEEIQRNIQAACLHYGLRESDINGRLFVNSGRKQPCVIAESRAGNPTILRPVVDSILREIEDRQIDVLMIDPFVSCHRLGENDNSAIDLVVKEWGMVAERGNCALDLTHHTRKLSGAEVTAESSRGAKALVDACRSVRVLNRMTPQEAERAGVDNHRLYFQAIADKVNLSPPAERADWFRLTSVDLENGPPGQSDLVGVAVRWKWPDALDGLTAGELLAVQKRIAQGEWRESAQSPDWAGKAVAEVLDLDLTLAPPCARVKSLLKTWIDSGALKVVSRRDEDRKDRKFIEVGQWATP